MMNCTTERRTCIGLCLSMCMMGACANEQKQDLGLALDFTDITFTEESKLEDPIGRYELTYEFQIMTTEVNQEQFELLMGYRCQKDKESIFLDIGEAAAYFISWNMAADFANQWSVYNGLETCYTCEGFATDIVCLPREDMDVHMCDGYRLPTEAEWELTARSGTRSEFWTGGGDALGGNYNLGGCTGEEFIIDNEENPTLSSFIWYCGNNETDGPKEVGLLSPNGFGLYDMHGNVWEWTHSGRGDFPNTEQNPDNQDPLFRILKGGGFHNNPFDLRVSFRSSYAPTKRLSGYGFRLARSLR